MSDKKYKGSNVKKRNISCEIHKYCLEEKSSNVNLDPTVNKGSNSLLNNRQVPSRKVLAD